MIELIPTCKQEPKLVVKAWVLKGALGASALYMMLIGVMTLFFPQHASSWMRFGDHSSCYPWIRYVGPMAIPLGFALILAAKRPLENLTLIQSLLLLGLLQIPLDLFLICTGVAGNEITLDLIFVGAVPLLALFSFPQPRLLAKLNLFGGEVSSVYKWYVLISLRVMFFYLLLGWFWAVFFPSLMNELLKYDLAPVCTPWVQFNGPYAGCMGASFLLAPKNKTQVPQTIFILGLGGCVLELGLDGAMLWDQSLDISQLWLDIIVVLSFLVCLLPEVRTSVSSVKRYQY
jgi:hypothetical protein